LLSILLVGGLGLFAFVKQLSGIWEEVGALGHQGLGDDRAVALGGGRPGADEGDHPAFQFAITLNSARDM
jgi:hypothetical protein